MSDRGQTAGPVNVIFYILFVILFSTGTASAEPVTIKVALITPEGSTWTNMLHQMADEVTKKSGGDVRFKIYPGGISGDELDVIRKMRAGRVHAAGFSGVGLGVLAPKIRILEAPLLYENEGEIDRVKEHLFGEFAEELDRKGYVLLGFAEAGFVYIFSKTDISDPGWRNRTRMWAWKGDPVAGTFLNILGIKTHPLHLTDVNTGLETGMIDSFYSPPLGAVAFQWHAKIRYVLDYPVVNSTGALIIKKDIFSRLSPEHQSLLKTTAKAWCEKLIRATREDNQEALAVMKDTGIIFVLPSSEEKHFFEQGAQTSRKKKYSRPVFGGSVKPGEIVVENLSEKNILRKIRQIMRPLTLMTIIQKLDHRLALLEKILAVLLFSTLAASIVFNIISRNLFDISLDNILEFSPALVLWLALIGSSLAIREQRHIKLEIFLKMAPVRLRWAAGIITSVFTMAVMAILLFAAIEFVKNEVAIFGAKGWPAVIFPVFFGAAFFRFFIQFATAVGGNKHPVKDI